MAEKKCEHQFSLRTPGLCIKCGNMEPVCPCGQLRSLRDPAVETVQYVHLHGSEQSYLERVFLRVCLGCGSTYVHPNDLKPKEKNG